MALMTDTRVQFYPSYLDLTRRTEWVGCSKTLVVAADPTQTGGVC